MLTGGVGYRRLEIPGTGSVRQRVNVDGAVSPHGSGPHHGRGAASCAVSRYALDGRR